MKTAVVVLADGFEEIEAVTPIDMLRRAGVKVTVAGLSSKVVKGANGVSFCADVFLGDVLSESFDAIVLPGGMPGASNLYASEILQKAVRDAVKRDAFVCAICASPAVVLGQMGLLDGKNAVCYPGMENYAPSVKFGNSRALRDGKFITSRGPGCSMDFALEIIKSLVSVEKAEALAEGTVWGNR